MATEKPIYQQEMERVVLMFCERALWPLEELKKDSLETLALDQVLSLLKGKGSITYVSAGEPKQQCAQVVGDKKFTKKLADEFLKEVFGSGRTKEKPWKDWVDLRMTIKLLSPTLAAMPSGVLKEEARNMVFDRNDKGEIVFRGGHWRALFGKATDFLDGFPNYGKDKVFFDPQPIAANGELSKITCICPGGTGFTSHEALKAGTELMVDVTLPTSRLSIEDFANAVARAGKTIGFSIAKSNQGYGRFEVVGVEVQ